MRSNGAGFVWQQMKVQVHMRALQPFSFGLIVTQPVIFSAVGYFLARAAGKTQIDLIHTVIGSGIMGLWSTMLFMSFYDLRSDRREGTLEGMVGSPTPLLSILSVRIFTNVLFGSLSFLLSALSAFLIFRFMPPAENLPSILVSLGVQFFGFWCIGLFLSHWSVVSRLTGYFVNYLELPVGLITGFMFPVSVLPQWAQKLSMLTPFSWSFNALSASLQPNPDLQQLAGNWLVSIGVAGCYLSITLLMSRKLEDMIRVTGELSSV